MTEPEQAERRLSPLPDVTSALVTAGLPFESAARFAAVAVEAVRGWLWHYPSGGCVCDAAYTDRGLEDPGCPVHDYDRLLGGNGDGSRTTPAVERGSIAVTAASLQEQFGEEIYREVFAPIFVKLLEELNGDTVNRSGGA